MSSDRFGEYREYIEQYLANYFGQFEAEPQKNLYEAMRYSLLAVENGFVRCLYLSFAAFAAANGKMLRPLPVPLR